MQLIRPAGGATRKKVRLDSGLERKICEKTDRQTQCVIVVVLAKLHSAEKEREASEFIFTLLVVLQLQKNQPTN